VTLAVVFLYEFRVLAVSGFHYPLLALGLEVVVALCLESTLALGFDSALALGFDSALAMGFDSALALDLVGMFALVLAGMAPERDRLRDRVRSFRPRVVVCRRCMTMARTPRRT
jgi:hypothetical protein